MLPDNGDNTETCWSCFNVNLNILFKQLLSASVGNKTLITVQVYKKQTEKMFWTSELLSSLFQN